jgi:hypothetical protein
MRQRGRWLDINQLTGTTSHAFGGGAFNLSSSCNTSGGYGLPCRSAAQVLAALTASTRAGMATVPSRFSRLRLDFGFWLRGHLLTSHSVRTADRKYTVGSPVL